MNAGRRALWSLGAPARWLLVGAIRVYQVGFSGVLGGGQCRFTPGCSRYAVEAIRSRGAIVGTALAVRRVLRCNPFGAGGVDPVPLPRSTYDTDIQNTAGRAERERAAVGAGDGGSPW